jgi:hypothetical protein
MVRAMEARGRAGEQGKKAKILKIETDEKREQAKAKLALAKEKVHTPDLGEDPHTWNLKWFLQHFPGIWGWKWQLM